jgi:hypothetical protein
VKKGLQMAHTPVVYYAFQFYETTEELTTIGVDTDAVALLKRLAEVLTMTNVANGRLESLEIGQVHGTDKDSAIESVRRAEWLKDTYGAANGVVPGET